MNGEFEVTTTRGDYPLTCYGGLSDRGTMRRDRPTGMEGGCQKIITLLADSFGPVAWSGVTFLAGIASKGAIDSYLRRKEEVHKFVLDKRARFLEQRESSYW